MPRPFDHGLQAWTYDLAANSGTFTPNAGGLYLSRVYIRIDQPVFVANLAVVVSTGGTGATALANCFMGIYDTTGNLLTNSGSADQSTPFSTSGFKIVPMTAAQLLQPGKNYWLALLIGTQSTTNVVFAHSAASAAAMNANLVNSTARGGLTGAGLTALPGSIVPGSTALANAHWAAVL